MKTSISFCAFLFFIFSANAQISYLDTWEDTPMNALVEYAKTFRPGLPDEYTGSFYLEEDFIPGVIEIEGEEKKLNVFLRYNALEDQVELKLKKDETQVYLLPKIENIYYRTPNYDYVWKSFKTDSGKNVAGYVMRYFDGGETKFFAKPMAHLESEVTPKSGYDRYKPAHMSVQIFYYLSVEEKPFTEVRLKEKQIKKVLPKNPGLKKYYSNHSIKTAEDVLELLKYYEEQRPSNS